MGAVRDHRAGDHHPRRARRALQEPCRHQQLNSRGEGTAQAGHHAHRDAGDQRPTPAHPIGQRAEDQLADGKPEKEGREGQLYCGRWATELHRDGGQGGQVGVDGQRGDRRHQREHREQPDPDLALVGDHVLRGLRVHAALGHHQRVGTPPGLNATHRAFHDTARTLPPTTGGLTSPSART